MGPKPLPINRSFEENLRNCEGDVARGSTTESTPEEIMVY